jgi:hypothetical protein
LAIILTLSIVWFIHRNYFIVLISLTFNDFYFFLSPILLLLFLWIYFFKLNTNLQKTSRSNTTCISTLKINPNITFVNFYLFLLILFFFGSYTIHGKNDVIWFNHFNLNNFTINLLYMFMFISFTTFFIINAVTKKANLIKSVDYIFSINNLVILLPYLFFVNTIFSFLFLLELVSVTLLYKLISSKIWFKKNNLLKNVNNNVPQNYINMVFFQYWVTFFSTIFIVYFYINIFYLYGTSEWFMLQFLNSLSVNNTFADTNAARLLIMIFILSVFFKLGITPFHLFKIEVYKGLPFLSIFFYTTYYFVVFFIFFIFLLSDLLCFFIVQCFLFLGIVLLIGCIYTSVLLFDVSFIKAFFTYSTIINTIGFLLVFIVNLQ